MANKTILVFVMGLLLCDFAQAVKIENLDFQDEKVVGSQKYYLNGAGVRIKKKIGMNFKVYVAALYLAAKNSDANEIMKSNQPKMLEIVFLREIDRETLQEAWQEGFNKNCKDTCSEAGEQFKAFNNLMVDVNDGSRLKMTFDRTGVNVDIKGTKSNSALLDGEAIRKSLLAIFIGDQPPTLELKKSLLGI